MRIVNTTCVYKIGFDVEMVMDRLHAAGFQFLDLDLGYCEVEGHPFMSDNWLDWAYSIKRHAEVLDVQFVQTHGVGRPSCWYKEPDNKAYRAIRVAEILGIKWIVLHPEDIPGKQEPAYDDLFVEQNAKWFRPYLERCAEKGIGIAIENLPWFNGNRAKPLADIVDALDSPYAGVCWDTGHANINHLPPSEMRKLGNRLVTLHVQDNYGKGADDHLIPFYGTYDWVDFIHTLRDMNYKGDFVLEAHHQMLDAKDEETKTKLLAEMLRVSQKIIYMP